MYKLVDANNIEQEHICCCMSEKKGEKTLTLKKDWMKARFKEGLIFDKLDVRGKVFIEYMPAEKAFVPVVADNYMYINCLWVSGKYKGQGYGNALLDRALAYAKENNKSGLVAISSVKKRHFLTEPKHLKSYGFQVADTHVPDFELLYYPLASVDVPKFKIKDFEGGNVLFYSHQCPYAEKYAELAKNTAKTYDIDLELRHIRTLEEAKNAPSPITTYALFLDGMFVTTEILTEKRFAQILKKHMLI